MSHRTRSSVFLPVVAGLACAVASPIVTADERVLEEVIVTAQKREQSLHDVPVAVTAFSAETIEAMGIVDTTDLTRASASLTFTGGGSKQNTGFRVRGIGTTVFSIGVEQSVAVVIDEVSQLQAGQALSNLVDIERIEVLRGPQSTLFGKNASAGLVNVITRSPTEEFEGYVELAATDDDEQKLIGVVSGPLNDELAYRISGFYRDYDGWADNLYLGEDANGAEEKGARAKLAWNPQDDLEVLFIAHYAKDDSNCCSLTHRVLDPEARLIGSVPATETNPLTLPRLSDHNADPETDQPPDSTTEDAASSVRVNWDVGDYQLTAISAYSDWQYQNNEDVDWSGFPIAEFFSGGTASGGIVSDSHVDTEFFSQELRVTSPAGETVEYLAGLYYADAQTDRDFVRTFPATADWRANAGTESMAAFGQLTWRFLENTQLTAGGRYNYEEISVQFDDRAVVQAYDQSANEGQWLGKVALQHFLNSNTMLYASAATGYKGQAYDISTGFDQFKADNPVGSEQSEAFEAGVKSTLLEQRLQLEVVAFHTRYDDYQAQNTEVVNDSLELTIANVGRLETSGVEVDAVALVGERLTLNTSMAYIDATIDQYPNAQCYNNQTVAQGCVETSLGSGVFVQDLAGAPLNNSPEYKVALGGQYIQPLDNLPFDGFVNASYQWQDDVIFDLKQDPGTKQDSYGVLNMSVGINERTQDRYRVTLFVYNVFDEHYTQVIADLSDLYLGGTAYIQLVPRNAERYAGVSLKYAF